MTLTPHDGYVRSGYSGVNYNVDQLQMICAKMCTVMHACISKLIQINDERLGMRRLPGVIDPNQMNAKIKTLYLASQALSELY